MDKNEVKKAIYKSGVDAALVDVRKDGISYSANVNEQKIGFFVPTDEIGEVIWTLTMPAKLLIRYLIDAPID